MSTLVTIQSTDLITNSRADINGNFSALNADKMETSVLDTDTTLAANSDAKVATQKAVKAYVDAGGNVNASTTTKGIVELATSAEIDAGTATGGTGAALVVTADALKGSLVPIVRSYVVAGSPHTWSKPAGLKYVVVEVQGGGQAGDGTTGDSYADGGAAGGYSRKLIGASSLGTTETVTVGVAGAASDYTTGGAGGNSSFGTHATANGGASGTGGTAASGDINIQGESGSIGTSNGGTAGGYLTGGGGNSKFGSGGRPVESGTGNAGTGYGSGGSGGSSTTSTDASGGAGAPGIVIVTEYYV